MHHNYSPITEHVEFPEKNIVSTVYIDEAMMIQGSVVSADFLQIHDKIDDICYEIPSGLYIKKGEENNKIYFSLDGDNGSISSILCDSLTDMYVSKDTMDKLCLVTIFGQLFCYDTLQEIIKKEISQEKILQKKLYYSEINDTMVTFMYAEENGPQILHSENVSFAMKDSNIIEYKGSKIEIISYSNEKISYKVLQGFSEKVENRNANIVE